ncbi:MAG: HupE/UreJ family protein [Bacteroidetes bacterium]|nr:HupE/UreJ family protein [Bacteroidota bacterium]
MNSFAFYFQFGWEHIMSVGALDHQLFLTALMALYLWDQWKKILILVTAFTLGHSLTLALSVLDWVRVDSAWVEFLIPLSIVLTCLLNLRRLTPDQSQRTLQYVLAAFFGLIHGLGFANNLRFMLVADERLETNLLAFNLGLELGQIAIVALLLALGYWIVGRLGVARRDWSLFLSAASFSLALYITLQRIP